MPINTAKKANSTAARRCTIRNFTLVPSLTCGIICRLAVHDRGDAGQEVVDHLYETCVPLSKNLPQRPRRVNRREYLYDLAISDPGRPPSLCPQLRTALERRWSGAETGWPYPLR